MNKYGGEDEFWVYNLIDCVRTREVGEVELATIESLGLQEVEAFQQKLFWPVLRAMQLGVRIDLAARKKLKKELEEGLKEREAYLTEVCGHPLNVRSSLQMTNFFFNDLGIKPVMSKKTKNNPSHLTCDDNALTVIGQREPLVLPIIRVIREYRTLGVLLSTFVEAKLDIDDRMRCSYNICGTETYRFNSGKNAFGCGTNLQNIPKGST